MENIKKLVKPFVIILYIILIAICVFFLSKNHSLNDLRYTESLRYQYKIDSLSLLLNNSVIIVDSLKLQSKLNDVQISYLLKHIAVLEDEIEKNKLKYNERDKNIQNMSNDSVVKFVRKELELWTE